MPNNIQKVIEDGVNALTLKFNTEEVLTSSGDYIEILEAPLPAIKSHIRTTISNVLKAIEEEVRIKTRSNTFVETKNGQVNCYDCKNLPVSPFCRHSQGRNDVILEIVNLLKSARDSVK